MSLVQNKAQATNVRYRVLFLTFILAFIMYLDRVCMGTAAPTIMKEFGLNKVTMGWSVSAFNEHADSTRVTSSAPFTWLQSLTGDAEIAQRVLRTSLAIPAVLLLLAPRTALLFAGTAAGLLAGAGIVRTGGRVLERERTFFGVHQVTSIQNDDWHVLTHGTTTHGVQATRGKVHFLPTAEYAFHHPLIRTVAYESQLKSDRIEWHRRLAAAIQERAQDALEENAALIAEHLEAAGELHAAYGWHMRAAAWSADRDTDAARASWERARRIADALPPDDPGQLSMRIAPTTMLCVTDWQARAARKSQDRFAELRELCSAAGDKVSLAIGMTGQATDVLYTGRSQSSRLASEQMALLETIGDPTLTIGLSVPAFAIWFSAGEVGELLRWTQTVIDLAAGDPTKGAGFGIGSPLAAALAWRGVARWWLGRPGWQQDLHEALAIARNSNPATLTVVVAWTYGLGIQYGVLRADESALRASEQAVHNAAGFSNDPVLALARYALGDALLSRVAPADRQSGVELMEQARDACLRERVLFLVPVTDLWIAREKAERGDRDAAIPVIRKAAEEILQAGGLAYGLWATGIHVETLLEGGAEGDLAEAQQAIDRLASLSHDGSAMPTITLLRLRALLARARADGVTFRELAGRYHAMAKSLGFEGHIDWAEAMIEEI